MNYTLSRRGKYFSGSIRGLSLSLTLILTLTLTNPLTPTYYPTHETLSDKNPTFFCRKKIKVMFSRVCGFRVRVPWCLTELPEVSGTGMKVLQNFQKFRVLWHGRTELTEVPGGHERCCTRTPYNMVTRGVQNSQKFRVRV